MYHVCTNSFMMIEIMAYSCKSTSLLLVKGGRSSLIGAGVLRPFSPRCEHKLRRIRNVVARSESGSADDSRALWRETGVCGLEDCSLDADADCAETLDVANALGRG